MRLTKNFTLNELTRSQTATRKGIDNTPGQDEMKNLIDLAQNVLQPLRDCVNESVFVNSGFRCKELNEAIGGSQTSQHIEGQAADIVVSGMSPKDVFNFIINNGIPFDQMIYEFGQWVHVSFRNKGNRFQKLEAYKQNGKTFYREIERVA
jgi:hypothetical protein